MLSIIAAAVLTALTTGQVSPSPRPSTPPASTLFSRRALRNARLLIQLRMLELREERLDCVREAIIRRLPPELTLNASSRALRLRSVQAPSRDEPAPTVKQSNALRTRSSRSEDCSWVWKPWRRPKLTA